MDGMDGNQAEVERLRQFASAMVDQYERAQRSLIGFGSADFTTDFRELEQELASLRATLHGGEEKR